MDATSGSGIPDDCSITKEPAIPDSCDQTDKADFAVGKKFNTLDSLEEAICRFQDQNFIQL